MKGRTLLQGAGIGILYTLSYIWTQLSPSHIDLYHRLLPINTIIAAIAIDLATACLIAAALLFILDRFDKNQHSILWAILFAGLAAKTVSNLIMLSEIPDRPVTPGRIFVVCCLILALLCWWQRPWYRTAVTWMRALLFMTGFCIFWMLPQLIYFAGISQPHDTVGYVRQTTHSNSPHRRIIWLLFDELSYDQLFDHRYAGLQLPNFDHFRSTAVSFSNVQPAGYLTDRILPSLLLGREVTDIRASMHAQLFVREDKRWQAFNPDATIFADAQRRGWTTGIVGWYNPYCRILPTQLNSCFWAPYSPVFIGHQSAQYSVFANALAPFTAPFDRMMGRKHVPALLSISDHLDNYETLQQPAMELLSNDSIDLAFIHLPIPHPPGIYNRQTQSLQTHGSYIDNLALTDDVLARALAAIRATPSADQTTIVISSDHSWRIPMWKDSFLWTKEDQRAYRGTFDQRSVLMIRFPGELQSESVDEQFPGLKLHALLEAMLDSSLNSPEDLKLWLSQQKKSGSE